MRLIVLRDIPVLRELLSMEGIRRKMTRKNVAQKGDIAGAISS
jgi:hypothetical protein